jgi:putative DNA primase/helicase
VETIKTISGGDSRDVDRKGKVALTGQKLSARFTIGTNEIPRFHDSSNAITSRFILLPFRVSFVGREDKDLLNSLYGEIPGITNWALEGLEKLRARDFYQPARGAQDLEEMRLLASPVEGFVVECCEVGDGYEEWTDDLYQEWCKWCARNGHESGSSSNFGKNLRAAYPVEKVRARRDGYLNYKYVGVGIAGKF